MKNLYVDNINGYWYWPPLKVKFFSLALMLLGIIFSANPLVLAGNLTLILLITLAGGGGTALLSRLKAFVFFGLFIIAFHSVLNPANETMLFIFGLEGALYGSIVAMRLTGIVALAQIALITTPPRKIFLLFSSFHKDLGLIMLLLVGFIPVLQEELNNTSHAQQTRGLAWKNSIDKIRAYLAMIIPVITKALFKAQGMASLLYLRGYDMQDRHLAKKQLRPLWAKGYRYLSALSIIYFLINVVMFTASKMKVWPI
jgi:energy-coupling factor transporter transmembrane protein EcfT